MNRKVKFLVGIILSSIGLIFLPNSVWAANYTLSVNAGTKLGPWDRFYERAVSMDHVYTLINSAYNRNAVNALRKAHDEAGFQSIRGHGILNSDVGVYSENTSGQAVYNWTNFDKIYDSIKAVGMRPLVEIGFMPPDLASASTTVNNVWYNNVGSNWNAPKDWTKWKALIKELIRHCKSRYGEDEVRNWFFEVWNEPNWMYGGGGGYNGWKTLYQNTAQAVMEEDSLIKLGGPAESGGSSLSAVDDFMKWTKQNHIKADFCSYHVYSNDMAKNCYAKGIVDFFQNTVYAAKVTNSFKGLLLNTEFGPSYSAGPDYKMVHDGEATASFLAKTIHLFNINAAALAPPYTLSYWALSDVYEEYDNRGGSPAFSGCFGLLTRGDPSVPQSCDLAKPAFNAYKLLHKMKNSLLSTSGGTTASPGVNLAATVSSGNDTICVMVYNHLDDQTGNSANVDSVTLNISNIPFTKAKIEHWVIDRNHSNAYETWVGMGSPNNPSASQWTTIAAASELAHYDSTTTVDIVNGSFTKKFPQNLYSVGLLQIVNAAGTGVSLPKKSISDAAVIKTRLSAKKLIIDIPAEEYHINLFSSSGRLMKSAAVFGPTVKEFSLDDLSGGAYFLECSGKSHRVVKSIVVGAR